MDRIHLVNPILCARFLSIFSKDQIFPLRFLILNLCFLFMEVKHGHSISCAVTETDEKTTRNLPCTISPPRENHRKCFDGLFQVSFLFLSFLLLPFFNVYSF